MATSLEDDLLANEGYNEFEGETYMNFEDMQALLDEDDEDDQDDGSGSSGAAPEPSSRPPPYDHDLLDFDPDDELDEDDLVTADLNVDDRELLEEGSGEDVNDNKQRSDEENVSPFPETFKKKVGSLDLDVPTRSKFESEKSGPQDLMNIKFDNVPQNNRFLYLSIRCSDFDVVAL